MATELLDPTAKEFVSWVRKYYKLVSRVERDVKTGVDFELKFDVCTLPHCEDNEKVCEKAYKHCIKNGTKNLLRHVVVDHRNVEAIKQEIILHNLDLSKVRYPVLVHLRD